MNIVEPSYESHPEVNKWRLVVSYFTWLIQILTVVFMLTLLILMYQTLNEGKTARKTLLDCTTPTGQCFKDGQQRTAEALTKINQQGLDREAITRNTVIAAAACAKRWDAIVLIRQCVEKELEHETQR